MRHYVITFASTHQAMAAENELDGKLPMELIPTPRQISAECGFTLLVQAQDASSLKALLQNNSLCYSQIFEMIEQGERRYEIVN
jgi:hypothetical protein